MTRTLNVLVVSARLKVFVVPLSEALSVAVAFIDPVLTGANWALVEPAGMVTLCGSTIAVLLLLNATVVAAVAPALSAAVQLLEEAPAIEVGVQASELSVGTTAGVIGTVIDTPVAEREMLLPAGDAAS